MRNRLRHLSFSHTEYLADILADSGGDIRHKFEIQPAATLTFPWLADVAGCFEKYTFSKLVFHYRPLVGTSTDGRVAFCPDYDAADDNSHLQKRHLLQFEDSVSGSVWEHFSMSCSPKNLTGRRFTRRSSLPMNLDIKTYDVGNLEIVGKTSVTSVAVGELFAEYTIRFEIPQRSFDLAGLSEVETSNVSGPVNPFSDTTETSGLANVNTAGDASIAINSAQQLAIREAGNYLLDASGLGTTITGINAITGGPLVNVQDIASSFSPTDFNVTKMITVGKDGGLVNWSGLTAGSLSLVRTLLSRLPATIDFAI
jgi:hypothetical protein